MYQLFICRSWQVKTGTWWCMMALWPMGGHTFLEWLSACTLSFSSFVVIVSFHQTPPQLRPQSWWWMTGSNDYECWTAKYWAWLYLVTLGLVIDWSCLWLVHVVPWYSADKDSVSSICVSICASLAGYCWKFSTQNWTSSVYVWNECWRRFWQKNIIRSQFLNVNLNHVAQISSWTSSWLSPWTTWLAEKKRRSRSE